MAVNFPCFQRLCSGANLGWRPKPRSSGSNALPGTPMSGRAARRLGSSAGTSALSPSRPPRRNTTTSVPSPGAAPNEARVVTRPVPSPATVAADPARNRRREVPPGPQNSR